MEGRLLHSGGDEIGRNGTDGAIPLLPQGSPHAPAKGAGEKDLLGHREWHRESRTLSPMDHSEASQFRRQRASSRSTTRVACYALPSCGRRSAGSLRRLPSPRRPRRSDPGSTGADAPISVPAPSDPTPDFDQARSNMNLEEALSRCLTRLRGDRRSEHTAGQCRRHIELLASWLRERSPSGAVEEMRHATSEMARRVHVDPRLPDVGRALDVLPGLPLEVPDAGHAGRVGAPRCEGSARTA